LHVITDGDAASLTYGANLTQPMADSIATTWV
jgi:hypothetical protein